jgi:hypothetical protein
MADHLSNAQKRAKRQTVHALKTGPCPTPSKLGFSSKAQAKAGKKKMRGATNLDDIKPYRCDCGQYHLGHKPGSLAKRLKKQGLL